MNINANARRSKRRIALMPARILYNKGMIQLDCIVRNLSEDGVKLQISGAIPLPDEFDLLIPHMRQCRRARLCWRRNDACGARFLDKLVETSESEALIGEREAKEQLRARIRQLERTIMELNARIEQLTLPQL